MTKPVEQPTEPTLTDAQVEAWRKAKQEQLQAKRQATIKQLEALADSLGYVIVAIPQPVEVAQGVVGFGAVWGVAEKAK